MDIEKHIEALKHGKIIPQRELKALCRKVIELLIEESNVQPVSAPLTVCGDIHGQFYDLLQLFRVGGDLPEKSYVFMGDYVDRGYNSVQTLELLLCLKLKYPDRMVMLRGNHQSRQITLTYGFHEETVRKYGNSNPWKYCNELFDFLPLGAIIQGKILCVHGGLSPQIKTIDQMRIIDRRQQIPHSGPFCDLMWSDPQNIQTWSENCRGAGWLFGHKVVKDFNLINGLELIARAHQLVSQGYQYWFEGKTLVTVWSVPNYLYKCGNDASIMQVSEQLERTFKIFKTVPQSMRSQSYKNVLPYFL